MNVKDVLQLECPVVWQVLLVSDWQWEQWQITSPNKFPSWLGKIVTKLGSWVLETIFVGINQKEWDHKGFIKGGNGLLLCQQHRPSEYLGKLRNILLLFHTEGSNKVYFFFLFFLCVCVYVVCMNICVCVCVHLCVGTHKCVGVCVGACVCMDKPGSDVSCLPRLLSTLVIEGCSLNSSSPISYINWSGHIVWGAPPSPTSSASSSLLADFYVGSAVLMLSSQAFYPVGHLPCSSDKV